MGEAILMGYWRGWILFLIVKMKVVAASVQFQLMNAQPVAGIQKIIKRKNACIPCLSPQAVT